MKEKCVLLTVILFGLIFSPSTFGKKAFPFNLRSFPSGVHMIDNFEDGNLSQKPSWWIFGNLEVEIHEHDPEEYLPYLGRYSVQLRGKTNRWYIGGMGLFLGLNGMEFNAIKLYVKGSGENSGVLVFQLYDDDNGNWEIEMAQGNRDPAFDDRFIYTLKINWEGWRTVIISLKQFRDDNPRRGDGIWNPNQQNKSGGLLQFQLIALANRQKGTADFAIDGLKFYKDTDQKLLDLPYLGAPTRVISDD